MKRIPIIIALFLAVPLIAVSQTKSPCYISDSNGKCVETIAQRDSVVPSKPSLAPQFTVFPKVLEVTVSLDALDKSRVDRLSDEEYARLQKLRQAVADEERKIALAHGVLLVPKLIHAGTNTCFATSYITGLPSCDTDQYQSVDRYQFRGQWLFINVPRKETK